MNYYKSLKQNIYRNGNYSIVPIRWEDRLLIMKWRNEQIYHLRQKGLLTKEEQDKYFSEVIASLFNQDTPSQILFSFLEEDACIGYGGLVHINWTDRNAEISFIIETSLEKKEFRNYWNVYLNLIEQVAFHDLGLHKIYTYAFDLRPHLYSIFEEARFSLEARLKDHYYFKDQYYDVVIHGKLKGQ